jgi:urate oxidase
LRWSSGLIRRPWTGRSALQQMLYTIGSALLAADPALCEVRLSLPN